MSRGIGKLQREIVDTLDDAKRYFADPASAKAGAFMGHSFATLPSYRGGAPHFSDGREHEPGWVTYGRGFRLRDDVYDLRASCRYLAVRHDVLDYGTVKQPLQISFSRAVRSLVRRELLYPLRNIVPIVEADDFRPPEVLHLSDGDYVNAPRRQCRFVMTRRPPWEEG